MGQAYYTDNAKINPQANVKKSIYSNNNQQDNQNNQNSLLQPQNKPSHPMQPIQSNPVQQVQQSIPSIKNYIGRISTNDLINVFKIHAIDNFYLNKEKFNLSIKQILSNLNVPAIAYTFLSDRLYELVDESGDGRISEKEFVEGMTKVLSNNDIRKRLSFECVLKNKEKRNFLYFHELNYYFSSCWISGYALIGSNLKKEQEELIKQGVPVPSISQLVTWAKKYLDNIKVYLENSLRESLIDFNKEISYDDYILWIRNNPQYIQIVYGNKYLTIATNLLFLDNIEFIV